MQPSQSHSVNKKKAKRFAMGCLFMLLSETSLGATQGTLGATSTGTVGVQITIPSMVRVSGLSDITLAPSSVATDSMGSTTACVYSNSSTVGGYSVTATSANGSGGTFAASGGSSSLKYSATWNDGTGDANLTSGTQLTGQTGAHTTSTTCSGGSNATFKVNFTATDMQAVSVGTYTDTVTLLVEPT